MPVNVQEQTQAFYSQVFNAAQKNLVNVVTHPDTLKEWQGDITDKLRNLGITIDQGCKIYAQGGGGHRGGNISIRIHLPPGASKTAEFHGTISLSIIP